MGEEQNDFLQQCRLGREISCTEHMIKRRICQMESESGAQPLTGGQGAVLGYIMHSQKPEIFQISNKPLVFGAARPRSRCRKWSRRA